MNSKFEQNTSFIINHRFIWIRIPHASFLQILNISCKFRLWCCFLLSPKIKEIEKWMSSTLLLMITTCFLCRLISPKVEAIAIFVLIFYGPEGTLVLLFKYSSFEVSLCPPDSLSNFSYFSWPLLVLLDLNMVVWKTRFYAFECLVDGFGKYRFERKMVGDLVRVVDEITCRT